MNIRKIIKISQVLDNVGLYDQADKFDSFVRIAQFAKMPSQYGATEAPKTGNPLIDAALSNMSNSAFGYQLGGERQFSRTSPYKSDFGPSGPAVLPTLTPTQFAQMEKEGRFQDLFDLQLMGGMQAQNYLAMSNENLIGLSTLISQYADPKVNENVRKSFFMYVLPGTITKMISQDLASRPLAQWNQRLQEFLNVLTKSAPNQVQIIRQSIKKSLETIVKDKMYTSESSFDLFRKNPEFKSLMKNYDISLPGDQKTEETKNEVKPKKEEDADI
jgi:hypothetical protein